jgi:hypothetical protein
MEKFAHTENARMTTAFEVVKTFRIHYRGQEAWLKW